MNTETKRHIDAARQVLVGVVPNPSSQIDQITNALIYKFMDDMDQSAIKQGGEPSFFIDNLEKYSWTRLMDSRIGNQERMNIYSEALIKFSESKQLPPLFREIFKSAFLPYRSPEVLGLFLKEIAYFDYSHPEELGNAYEYLLSIMSSQGDAGQFRTPRHIIDFIVEVVDPTIEDKVLDPACGTGGFLVSAYNHIAKKHDGKNSDGTKNNEKPLTPDQRKTLMNNFEGYDIDPSMVRIAQVNMYLHQFKNPKINNYNTLADDERWNDKFSVILANPPFMSPKGGVSTHSKFSIQSTRSEVLFVDYIMNHLRPQGRAGVIVPEGIIFQSGTAHKQLRKNLVEDGLYAVVSLPSGVFQPYSGVKTSILLFNNELAKQSKEILFVKIENDGFDLGATKRPINKNDLPEALDILNEWKKGKKVENTKAVYIEKTKIAESEDYNLSVGHYGVAIDYANIKWPIIELKELCEITTGKKDVNEGNPDGEYPFFTCAKENTFIDTYSFDTEALLIAGNGDVGAIKYYKGKFDAYQRTYVLNNFKKTNTKYIYQILNNSLKENLQLQKLGNTMPYIKLGMLQTFKIPIPPLEVQEQIVAELDSYAGIIAGAKQIISIWKPSFTVDPKWEMVTFGNDEVLQIIDGDRGTNYPKKDEFKKEGYCLFLSTSNVRKGIFDFYDCDFITKEKDESLRKGKLQRHDVILTTRGTLGNTAYYSNDIHFDNIRINSGMVVLRSNMAKILPTFLLIFLNSNEFDQQVHNFMSGSAQPQLPIGVLNKIKIPLPPIEIQEKIVERIESERILVEGNKKLIEIYEQKTKDTLAKLWEE
ncbi:MAG: N-6 DNA methylase [Candidatus Roizmanbacteria bacterium]|nr:N-6 DNA methylase [Candidatus Roizmanbacteria bacterium]